MQQIDHTRGNGLGMSEMASKKQKRLTLAQARDKWPLAKVNSAVEKRLKTTAAKAEKDRAFRLFVRTALNGETDKVTGWRKQVWET